VEKRGRRHYYSFLTTRTVTSLEFPPFLNLLKEQMWYQPWTTGLKYPEVKGLEVGVEHTPVARYIHYLGSRLYGIRGPIIDSFRAWKQPILMP